MLMRVTSRLLLQCADVGVNLQLDVVAGGTQAIAQVRLDQVFAAAEITLTRRLDHDEDVGVDHGGDLHRGFHQHTRQLQLHSLQMTHQSHERVGVGRRGNVRWARRTRCGGHGVNESEREKEKEKERERGLVRRRYDGKPTS